MQSKGSHRSSASPKGVDVLQHPTNPPDPTGDGIGEMGTNC